MNQGEQTFRKMPKQYEQDCFKMNRSQADLVNPEKNPVNPVKRDSRRVMPVQRSKERGSSLVEMVIGASVLMTVVFGVLEVGRLLFTHNALAEAARKGARYAAISTQNVNNVKNFVVYGTTSPGVGATPVVYGMTTSNVNVTYTGFGVKQGTVTVEVTSYVFNFNVPIFGGGVTMPSYKSTLTGESAGYVPGSL